MWAPQVTFAQENLVLRSPIVVLDRERLYRSSQFGTRLLAGINAERNTILAENRQIEAQLTQEEQALNEQRQSMDRLAFQELADAFDAKVKEIRRVQDLKAEALARQVEAGQARFFEEATPVLADLAQSIGALVVLDQRDVLAAADQIDITDAAIARIDAALGRGEDMENEGAQPAQPQDTGSLSND